MTRSHSHKEKSECSNPVPQDEGTCARTRPLSYDDIRLGRNNKRDAAKQVASDSGVAESASGRGHIEMTYIVPEYHRQINEGSEPMDAKRTLNDSQKVSWQRKVDSNTPKKNDKLVGDKDEVYKHPVVKLKSIWEKTEGNRGAREEEENDRRHHISRKRDGHLGVDSYIGSNKRQARDSYRKDKTSERGRVKSETNRNQLLNDERQVHRNRKTEWRRSSDSEKAYKTRNQRDGMYTERLTKRGSEKSENKNRHERPNEEDKTKIRSTDKILDSGRKRLDPARVSLEKSREKRRRAHSKEHEKDRGRRPRSHSPKAPKHTLKDKKDHEEISTHSTKDISGRENSDVDKKRISTNGSSSQNRRNAGPTSGLGGYSPRKRKTGAAAKTPSPTHRSPEKRAAGWDLQPVENESVMTSSTLPNLLLTVSQNLTLSTKELPGAATPVTPTTVKPIVISHEIISSQMRVIESVQLTQATRPMRRLYVENLPPSTSDKDLIECINKSFLSYGVKYIQGTQPCISCIIHKEKSQALLEFLTPEDASSALALDGMSFFGSNLKIRRPKDFANVTTGLSEKSVVAVDSVNNVVEDSAHKIFIGGISKLLSSKMLLEIVRAFGPVKAFHFEYTPDPNEPCAFLEYVDHSVTSKACAGLNGMKLGGRVVSAVFATPEAVLENVGKTPFYFIPEHAKPLLEKPTPVLKLKNVMDPEALSSFSDLELEDILEDIKLECSRFGTVQSIKVSNSTKSVETLLQVYEIKNTNVSTDASDIEFARYNSNSTQKIGENINQVGELDKSEATETKNGLENISQTFKDHNRSDNINTDEAIAGNLAKDDENINVKESEHSDENKQNASVIEGDLQSEKDIPVSLENADMDNKPRVEENFQNKEHNAKSGNIREGLNSEESCKNDNIISNVFEDGSVFVEYRRPEAACMAAHGLHGRIFDGRVVTVEYVGQDLYRMMMFHK